MKVVGYEAGKAFWFIPAEEMRPLHGLNLANAITLISGVFNFREQPDVSRPWSELSTGPMTFRGGTVVREEDNKEIHINSFDLYTDVLAADCYDTEQSEWFLNHVMEWGKLTLGLRDPIRSPRKMYQSQLVIEFENDINPIIKQFSDLSATFGQLLNELYGIEALPEVHKLTLQCDKTLMPTYILNTDFTIERRENRPYSERRFWCQAALHTQQTIQLAEQIEKIAGD
jgi:hypothetical protein